MTRTTRVLSLLLVVSLVAPAAGAGVRPPNVVFFLVDDLGWRDLGCYGSRFHETPRVDRFASQAVRFTQAYAAAHVCSPTRASIMTGRYPATLGLTDWLPGRKDFPFQKLKNATTRQQLPFEEVTLAEALREHGYATGHFGKWHLGEEPSGPLRHGFDVQVPRWNKGWPRAGYHAPFGFEGLEGAAGDYLTDRLTDEALKIIERHRDGPFLLYLFPHYSNHGRQSPGGAVRRGDFKLLEYFEIDTVQLFNLRDDPRERHDLAGAQPEKAAELRKMLRDWRKRISARMMEPNPDYSLSGKI